MMMRFFQKIFATTHLSLVAGACVGYAAPDMTALAQAEQQIRFQWQKNPKLSYHSLAYKGTLKEWGESGHYVQKVRTVQGTWVPVHALPPSTLVFRGESRGYNPITTKGGAGYFFCSPETGELVAYLLMK